MVPVDAPLASVDDVFNAVVVEGDFVQRVTFVGRGAGRGPTASAVVADLIDIARGHSVPTFGVPYERLKALPRLPISARRGAYYVRLEVLDQPGVIADVAAAMRDEAVSMEQVLQQGRSPNAGVPVVITTHETDEGAMLRALATIERLKAVVEKPRMIRIEQF
jgi:homoserine dehydrogenase